MDLHGQWHFLVDRRTTKSEARYHSYDWETLALVEGIKHFRVYGVQFTIYTDCNSIRVTTLKKHFHPRVARWWIQLQDYDLTIRYRTGKKWST